MVLGVSRIGSTDSAQQPIYGAVFALARVSRGLIPPAQPHMEPQLRCADCLLSVGGWEGVGGTRKLLVRAQEVFCSAKGDLPTTFSSQHLAFSMLPLPYRVRLGWGFEGDRIIGVLPRYLLLVWLHLCKIHTFGTVEGKRRNRAEDKWQPWSLQSDHSIKQEDDYIGRNHPRWRYLNSGWTVSACLRQEKKREPRCR